MILPYIMEVESCCVKGGGSLLQGMNSTSFENRSTTTRIESNPFDNGRSVVKFTVTSAQGMFGNSRGQIFPGGARFDGFIRAHLSHLFVYSLTNVLIPGQVQLLCTSSSAFSLPGCPVIGVK
jgi:hypothetical protein